MIRDQIIERLYGELEDLRKQALNHKAKTLSKQGFRAEIKSVCAQWAKARARLPDSKGLLGALDESFAELLNLSMSTAETRAYRTHLKLITTTLFKDFIVASQGRTGFADVFEILDLHPRLKEVAGDLFRDGHYASAVLEAFKAVNLAVKAKSALNELDGQKLMSRAFDENNPVLVLNELQNQSDKDEQQGYRFIYMGVMAGIRNPKAHEVMQLRDPVRASELLVLASLLMKHVDASTVKA